jgi:hypothetical protein
MLVIVITRLHAMYRSRKMLIFLVVSKFLAVSITCGILTGIQSSETSGGKLWSVKNSVASCLFDTYSEELVTFGTHQCFYNYGGDAPLLIVISWILATIWEVIALCLAAWTVVKHFIELPRSCTVGDCFMVLIKTHVLYFAAWVRNLISIKSSPDVHASFATVSCFHLGLLSPKLSVCECVT